MPTCPLCENEVTELTCDHIIPRAILKDDTYNKKHLICATCNRRKERFIDGVLVKLWKGLYQDAEVQRIFNPRFKGD
jgi:CRISPR/Cas system Type II protein with McrA/HNH and RuvC-like nuclease domain